MPIPSASPKERRETPLVIGYLKGTIIQKAPDRSHVVLRSGGIGFEVSMTQETYDKLEQGQKTALWIHLQVREDAMTCYGFLREDEKRLFRILLTASGLGPKTALSLLAEHGPQGIIQLISRKDADGLSSAPGVGKKLAQKLILELGTKIDKIGLTFEGIAAVATEAHPAARVERDLGEDIASALANLGFTPAQIKVTLDRLRERDEWKAFDFETGLRTALKELSGRVRPSDPTAAGTTHG